MRTRKHQKVTLLCAAIVTVLHYVAALAGLHARRPAAPLNHAVVGHAQTHHQRLPAAAAATTSAPVSSARPLSNVNSTATDAELSQQMGNLIKGFSSQTVERGYWVEESMVRNVHHVPTNMASASVSLSIGPLVCPTQVRTDRRTPLEVVQHAIQSCTDFALRIHRQERAHWCDSTGLGDPGASLPVVKVP